jgi:hypothetical protein
MFKNFIILFLMYIAAVLLVEEPYNAKILEKSFYSTKEFIEEKYNHLIDSFSQTNIMNQSFTKNWKKMTES